MSLLSDALYSYPAHWVSFRTFQIRGDGAADVARPAGGCAAKYSAARPRDAARRPRAGRGGGPARRARPGRRRRGLPARRRARARVHGRLLPAARRRPEDLRRDRRDERAQRRLRDGRHAAARALGRGVPRGAADRGARRGARRRRRARPGGGRDPRGRPHDPRRRAEVRARGRRHRAPGRALAEGGARPGDALFLTKPLGTGIVLQAQRDGGLLRARSRRRSPRWSS